MVSSQDMSKVDDLLNSESLKGLNIKEYKERIKALAQSEGLTDEERKFLETIAENLE